MDRVRPMLILAVKQSQAFPVAAALYSIVRAGVRFWGFALPGQCTLTVINLSLATGVCVPAGTWLTTRVSQYTSAHAWSWVMYGAFALIVALWRRPPGSFNGWTAFMLVGFTVAYHELFWFGAYFWVNHNPADMFVNFEVYGSFMLMMAVGIGIMLALRYAWGWNPLDTRILLVGLGVFTLFMAGWVQIGYPLSLDLKIGVLPTINDPTIAFIEFMSWLLAFMVTGAAYYAKRIRS